MVDEQGPRHPPWALPARCMSHSVERLLALTGQYETTGPRRRRVVIGDDPPVQRRELAVNDSERRDPGDEFGRCTFGHKCEVPGTECSRRFIEWRGRCVQSGHRK